MLKKTYLIDDIPGSISNIYEIKILICRILNEIRTKITKNQLNTVLQLNETVNYFNFCQALKELLKSKHIVEKNDGEKKYLCLTNLGEETANILNNNLSKHTVEKNIKFIKEFLKKEYENKGKKIYVKKKDDGYTVKLILEEAKSNLIDLELFCPTSSITEKVKNQMDLKKIDIYKEDIAIINKDKKTIIKITYKIKKKKK